MQMIAEILVSALLVIGGFFGLVAAIGLIRLPDPMMRLHAPGKAATLGVGMILIASMLWFALLGSGLSWHELLITLFLLVTAPITGHFLAKVNLHHEVDRRHLPPTGTETDWAIYAEDDQQRDEAAR